MTAWDGDSIRQLERESIRAFLQSVAPLFHGAEVLDYGCGQQQYADVVAAAGGRHVGYDRADLPANVSGEDVGPDDPLLDDWDAILCTQVVQYEPDPAELFSVFRDALDKRHGALVLTGPTNWAEVEQEDLHRFTVVGVRMLLEDNGFTVERLERRAVIDLGGFELSLGYGAVARA